MAVQSWSDGGGPSGLTTRCTAPRRSLPFPPSRCPTSSTPATGSQPMWWPSSCARWAREYGVGDGWGVKWAGERQPQDPVHVTLPGPGQVIEKERPQLAECEEASIYSPAFPREKWQRKRTQVKIRVCALSLAPSKARRCLLSPTPPPRPFRVPPRPHGSGPTSSCLRPASGYSTSFFPNPCQVRSRMAAHPSRLILCILSFHGSTPSEPEPQSTHTHALRISALGWQKRPPRGPRPSTTAAPPPPASAPAWAMVPRISSPASPTSGCGLTPSPPARTSLPTTGRTTQWCVRAAPRC